jgi:Ca-activated chloride channel family protein
MTWLALVAGCSSPTDVFTPYAVPRAGAVASPTSAPPADPGRSPGPSDDDGASGRSTYLSNDDSLSLASAQHLLHAVKRGLPYSVADIRPHELLNYFTFQPAPVEPGHRFSVRGAAEEASDGQIALGLVVHGAAPARRPLDLTLVVDRSGSMREEGRMDYVKRGLRALEAHLAPGDRVSLVAFDDRAETILEGWTVDADRRPLLRAIDALAPDGGTNLGVGLRAGYRLASHAGDGRDHRLILLTDANANQGTVDAVSLSAIAAGYRDGVELTAVGVGVGFDDRILDAITESGHGGYVYLGSEEVVDRLFGSGWDGLVATTASDVRFRLDLPPSLAMARFRGEEASADPREVQPIEFAAGTTQLFLQDLRASSPSPSDVVRLTVEYADDGARREESFSFTVGELLASDGHDLRKAEALMSWSDVLAARAMGVDACGKPWHSFQADSGRVADTEIDYVRDLVSGWCPTAAYKVRVDADVPVDEVRLACGDEPLVEKLAPNDNIALFSAPAGACRLSVAGRDADVVIPRQGGGVRCLVRDGLLACG